MKKYLFIVLLIGVCFGQNIEVYNTNKYGLKDLNPSIIIDENSTTGEYEVFSVNKYGLRNINPDEIINKDEYIGTWSVYRVNDYGLKDLIPDKIAEENNYNSKYIDAFNSY